MVIHYKKSSENEIIWFDLVQSERFMFRSMRRYCLSNSLPLKVFRKEFTDDLTFENFRAFLKFLRSKRQLQSFLYLSSLTTLNFETSKGRNQNKSRTRKSLLSLDIDHWNQRKSVFAVWRVKTSFYLWQFNEKDWNMEFNFELIC